MRLSIIISTIELCFFAGGVVFAHSSIILAVVNSFLPARSASQLTVREVLAYE